MGLAQRVSQARETEPLGLGPGEPLRERGGERLEELPRDPPARPRGQPREPPVDGDDPSGRERDLLVRRLRLDLGVLEEDPRAADLLNMPADLRDFVAKMDVPLLGTIPANSELTSFEFSGKPLVDLPDDSPVYQAVSGMMSKILS